MTTPMQFKEYHLYIDGQWVSGSEMMEVKNKYTGEAIGVLPVSSPDMIDRAIASAERAAPVMANMPAHKRAAILLKAASLIEQRQEEIARTIAAEAGKALKFARVEANRAFNTFTIAAEEAKRIHGEQIPLDAVPYGEGFFGFTVKKPVGVVAAITPFNFPLNLVAHKVAPAIAAGCTLIVKPANTTPLTSVILAEILADAGMPPGAFNLINGSGAQVGEPLVKDPRVQKVTFTGSPGVGERILSIAGIKKVTLELGNTSPMIIAPDADLDLVAKRGAVGAFYNSGQVCISVQRIYGDRQIMEPFTEMFVRESESMVVGDPLDERVDVGPMIDMREVDRIESWVDEATQGGARILTGGRREGPVYWPTVLTDVQHEMKVVSDEVFAPVASVIPYDNFEEALEAANGTEYGLQASVFTRDIDRVFTAIKKLNFGGVIINESPAFRADHMPYGGVHKSGLGREGLKYAIEEMTHLQMVAIRTPGW
jgi:acyl-CoA reductase-like NAD-dependent aldehyde dehydrogenase